MNFFEAFRETLFRFDLKGNELSERSGLTEPQISDFRNGKNLRIDSVQKILDALEPEARNFMLDLLKVPIDADSVPLPKRSKGKHKSDQADRDDEVSLPKRSKGKRKGDAVTSNDESQTEH